MRIYRRNPDNAGMDSLEQDPGARLGRTAQIIAAASIGMIFFFPVLLPCIPASIAIVLAIISKGSRLKLSQSGRAAVAMGIIAIAISTFLLVFSVLSLISISKDPQRLAQMNEMLYRMYGMSLQEMLEQAGLGDIGLFR